MTDGYANFEQCAKYYCNYNLYSPIFQCPDQMTKNYAIAKLPEKYDSCLKNVSRLLIPRLVDEIMQRSLDQFTNVVKIEFLGKLFIKPDNRKKTNSYVMTSSGSGFPFKSSGICFVEVINWKFFHWKKKL